MQEFGKFDSIWVSTDHEGIAECAQACGAKVFMTKIVKYIYNVKLSDFSQK